MSRYVFTCSNWPRHGLRALVLLLAGVLAACSPPPESLGAQRLQPVGYRELEFNDAARQRPLAVKLWYPAAADSQQQSVHYNPLVSGYAAPDAPYQPADRPRPLLLVSHGDRGDNSNQAWLAETLAGQGYLVAAVDHWQNTSMNHVEEETVRVWHRPADVSFVLTALLRDPDWGRASMSAASAPSAIPPAAIPCWRWRARSTGGSNSMPTAGSRRSHPIARW